MTHIMGNFSGCLVFMFSAWFINIGSSKILAISNIFVQ